MPEPVPSAEIADLPLVLACLCELRDADGRVLLIERMKEPNRGLFSPIGGKLEPGESPAQCARREILEEAGLDVPIDRLRLAGIISERAYLGKANWLMFWFRVLGQVMIEPLEIREGRLDWHDHESLDDLPLPETDRRVIWPLVRENEDSFFSVHIDCVGPEMTWEVESGRSPFGVA